MGEKEQRKPYSKGESKREADSGKAAPQGPSSLGYVHRDSSTLLKTATFTMEVVHQASKGRKGQPPGPPARTSRPAERGRRRLLLGTSTKAPSVLRRNSNNKGPQTARTGPGAGRMKAGGGKEIKPEGAEARRSRETEAQRRGAR